MVERTWVRTTGHWRDDVLLRRLTNGWQIRGQIRSGRPNDLVDTPFEGSYQIDLDDEWRTRVATIQILRGRRTAEMRIRLGDDGHWRDLDEEHLETLDGLEDIDLFLTPATNSIPIRRLNLGVGEEGHVSAGLIQLGANDRLFASRLDQHYERLTETTYRYQSFDAGGNVAFTADLVVDGAGVVERYGDLWVTAPPV
jgi:hypothetical protein